uniref:Uncharacterized protein n=1 Tax=viral metagenome TaxID=1070528 RepID=A0A6M3XLQ6_9ZZZZ
MKMFWSLYRFIWWRIPGNRSRYRELLRHALKEDTFTSRIKGITTRDWMERIRKPDRWSTKGG